ncbi:hypothetical protein CFOL_v3_35129, partial [Cephalotus follicularis]
RKIGHLAPELKQNPEHAKDLGHNPSTWIHERHHAHLVTF